VLIKITSKRQVTFPAKVLDDMGVEPGDQLELTKVPARRRRLEAICPARERAPYIEMRIAVQGFLAVTQKVV